MPALPAICTPPSAGAGWARHDGYEKRTRSRERGGSARGIPTLTLPPPRRATPPTRTMQGGGAAISHAGSQQAGGGEPRMGTATATATGEEGEWRDAEERRELFVCSARQHTSADGLSVRAAVPHAVRQAALQLQRIAAQHSVPISYAHSSSGSQAGGSRKRPLESLTPAANVDGDRERDVVMPPTPMPTPGGSGSGSGMGMGMTASTSGTSISSLDTEATGAEGEADGLLKKKRRVALTRVGDL
ncbi:hypothetical protein B0H16DRAFT_738120 [Mycena metata]|uniref:Uncharacterized protein n=1 Tax=Mycena metata TaxID=1033252 RepID=A0AAD7J196_9AGAR|nr:hypothetical protein B0H16DRAFT_738120 [Mycena metata]